ncbi:MAG TPA: IS4 family transposase [Rhizobium sp.]|nr:IS4 family transposase [Rhizobium sp.]
MPHHNIVFHDLLKLVPWSTLEELVKRHGADADAREFKTKEHLIALLYGQLSGASSLREMVDGLESHADCLYHLGGKAVKRSTLADANIARPSAVFSGLLAALIATAHRRLRQEMGGCIRLIDSTSIRLNKLSANWARFSAGVCGVKAHVVYDPAADCPTYVSVTTSRVNDITAAQDMPVERGATYVFDLGYYDYAWWRSLHDAGCRIVTRFKSNTPLTVLSEQPVAAGTSILSDRIGLLPKRQAKNRQNPFSDPVREIRVVIDSGKILRIFSNDLTASAQEIADLYKRRWAIELFFRWVKQTLRIRKFFGASENAIRIQIAVALTTFLLLRLAQQTIKCEASPIGPLAFARGVRANLMHRRRIDELQRPRRPSVVNPRQMEFAWAA